jgi:ABC-type dipeptide/oligopeptide/nickel transport system permease subunit
MKNKRNRAVSITEIVLALPVLFLLWVLAAEFIEKYGLIVLPVGGAVYLVIFLLVDKLFSRQSEQLEQALERKLSFGGNKPGTMQKDG